jgi:DNA-binding NarL/FixJ family response regulator
LEEGEVVLGGSFSSSSGLWLQGETSPTTIPAAADSLRRLQVSNKIGVYVLAANRLLREALAHTFKSRTDIEVLGSTEQPQQGLESIAAIRPSVILVNGAMPGFDWAAFIPEAKERIPESRVVIFGMPDDPEAFFQAIRLGVVGYVLSEASANDLVAAVRAAARDEAVCPPRLCMMLFNYVARQACLPNPQLHMKHGLTRREQQLLPLIAQGLTNKEIAIHLCLSEQTIKNHVHRILRKVGAENRLSAAQVLDTTPWQA